MAESGKEDLAAAFKTELFNDTIYVLTPHGKVLSLPTGATPIDFAYALHSSVGDRCRGAKSKDKSYRCPHLWKTDNALKSLPPKREILPSTGSTKAGSNPTAPSAKSVPTSASKMQIPYAKKAVPS